MTEPDRAKLAVVIPTRDRRAILVETLSRLARYAAELPIEVIVVDDGSRDDTVPAVTGFAASAPWPLRLLRQDGAGPAAARNRGTREAEAPVCLYIGDDSLPTEALVRRHVSFHDERPQAPVAMLGLVAPAPPLDESPFVRWLHEEGTQFGYAALRGATEVPPSCFWTSNVSVKRELVLGVGGFDEGFPGAACEDAELGFRLARAGMRLRYDPEALALHFHPTDLGRTLERMRVVGVAFRRLCELAPEIDPPTRPGLKHRLRSAALTAAALARRRGAVRTASWRFLCDEVQREAYWGAGEDDPKPRIGRLLSRLAASDPIASPQSPAMPAPAGPPYPAVPARARPGRNAARTTPQ